MRKNKFITFICLKWCEWQNKKRTKEKKTLGKCIHLWCSASCNCCYCSVNMLYICRMEWQQRDENDTIFFSLLHKLYTFALKIGFNVKLMKTKKLGYFHGKHYIKLLVLLKWGSDRCLQRSIFRTANNMKIDLILIKMEWKNGMTFNETIKLPIL